MIARNFNGYYALYFKSRKAFEDKKTWRKEKLPLGWTTDEVAQAAKLSGNEGFAIIHYKKSNFEIKAFEWFI